MDAIFTLIITGGSIILDVALVAMLISTYSRTKRIEKQVVFLVNRVIEIKSETKEIKEYCRDNRR